MRRLLVLAALAGVVGLVAWRLVGQELLESKTPRPEGWGFTPPGPGAKAVSTESRLGGIYPVGSRVADHAAPGGFGGCDNFPVDLGDKEWGEKGKLSLVVEPDEVVAYFKYRGVAVRLVNRTNEVKKFAACDSCLYLVQEAQDEQGVWREIEDLPSAICGNSFHQVALKPGQFWEIKARAYHGPMKTKLRFRLDGSGESAEGEPIYSREFDGRISKQQLRRGPGRAQVRRAVAGDDPKVAIATLVAVVKQAENEPQLQVVRNAALQLGGMGPAAKDALPALHAAMTMSRYRAAAAYASFQIEGLKPEYLNAIRADLTDLDAKFERVEAARLLGQIGPPAADAVPDLVDALASTNRDLPPEAARSLGLIRSRPAVAVPGLIWLLKKDDWYLHYVVANALAEFGADAKSAVPQLLETLKTSERSKTDLASALWKIQGKDDPAIAELAIETLRKEVVSKDYSSSWSAAWRLGEIGPPAKAAIPELTAALKEGREMSITAARALWRITNQPEPSLAALIRGIQGNVELNESNTTYAIDGLADMGEGARAATPALVALHRRADAHYRAWIQERLAKIDPDAAMKLPK